MRSPGKTGVVTASDHGSKFRSLVGRGAKRINHLILWVNRNVCLESLDDLASDTGTHWTYEKGSYKCNTSGTEYNLEAFVNKDQVEWYMSIARHVRFPDEQEINFSDSFETEVKVYDKDWNYIKTIDATS
jgi:protein associated with RNAse G/E